MIGDLDDPHAMAVLDQIKSSPPPYVMNAATLADSVYCMQDARLTLTGNDANIELASDRGIRGWIRRLAPADWNRGVAVESLEAAEKTAWLTLLTAALRTCGVEWLTDIDALITSENKLVQYAAAMRIGVRTPPTVVTNDPVAVRDAVGFDLVLKPLGPGHFFDGDQPFTVFATAVNADSPELQALAAAPFLIQERIAARSHLRVVTVCGDAWGAELDASGQPMDWRAAPIAHRSFTPVDLPEEVAGGALSIAAELSLGYTSQDWVIGDDGAYLLDVNPAGQWLFLPSSVADPVTSAIASWLGRNS
ncbi:hypothetical protein [Streptosporangium sp. NPDC049046]|uniref:ATP-grasp domain-containing protein n=1 Tax=unclassified Streptosporangium TaxID=2632669 RepID=UPI003434CB89